MATSYPASLDSFTNPTAVDTLDSPPHDTQHADANDAIEALQAKVGVDGSAVTTSLDYKIANLESRPVETKTASYVLVAADVNKRIVMNSASATTITVNTGIFSAGDTVWIHNIGAGTTTVTAGTATVNTAGSLDVGQWEGGSLYFTSASSAIFFRGGGAGITADFLVIAGGGGAGCGGTSVGGGAGGAGGYRNSFNSESSGGGASAEASLTLARNIAYPITVGAGGVGSPGSSNGGAGAPGTFSQFAWISTVGGGLGASFYPRANANTFSGGSAGGTGTMDALGSSPGTVGQGYSSGGTASGARGGTGGGGAGAASAQSTSTNGTAGGTGVASTITGSSVTRGGGGGGGGWKSGGGAGGAGGGGAGNTNTGAGTAGTVNTGGGGGGGGGTDITSPYYGLGGNGGSGIVIFRVPDTVTVTMSAGVTYTEDTSTASGFNIVEVTATSTLSETVTFS